MKTKHSRNKKNRQVMPGMILAAVLISIGLSLLANGRAREIHSFSLPSVPLIIPSAFLPQEVDIPDPNLEKALLEACGKSPGYKLTDNDLWGLTGRLGVDRRNIKDLEGIQHCVNVTRLDVSGNPVNHLPDIQSMKKLEDLDLQQCQLTQVPPIVSKLPNLRELILSENPIGNTLQGLDGCKNLERLYLTGCGISSFPADMDLPKLGYLGLSNNQLTSFPFLKGHKTLECIDVADNQISELPADLGVYPKLEGLYIDGNKVKRLPDKMGNLIKLDAFGNELTGLPDSIGKSKLEQLHVRGNNLTSLPLSLFASSNLKELDVSYNRLTSLPQGLDGVIGTSGLIELDVSYNQLTSLSEALFKAKHLTRFYAEFNRLCSLPPSITEKSWGYFDICYNYLDISSGSSTLKLLQSLKDVNIYFEPQLTPVKGLKAEAGEDWIKLSWKACPDFTYQQDTITVAHYEVFLDQGGKWTSLGKVDKGSPSFTHSALSPGTGYKYSVQVANDILYMYEGVFHKLSSYSSSRLSAQTIQAATTASTTPASTDLQTTGQSEEPEPETRLATDPHETTAQVQTTRQTETDIRESLPGSEATSEKGTSPLLWLIPLIVLVLATAGGLVWFFVIRRNHKKDSSLPGE